MVTGGAILMPSIQLNLNRLTKLLGKSVPIKSLEYDLQWIGLDVENIDFQENVIKVEYPPNRPDFASPEGIARALKGFYCIEEGLASFMVTDGPEIMHIDPEVRKIRPYVVGGIIRDIHLEDDQIKTLMNIQEALHWAIGRDRKKVAIGIHDYDKVRGPYNYTIVSPTGVRFRPLHMEAFEMTPKEILEEHEMGRQYAHLLRDFSAYPIIYDAEKKVVSLPPIINGTYTTVTDNTRNLLLDLTGTDFQAVNLALNIIATTFADMGGKIETITIENGDDPSDSFRTPNLSPRIWVARPEYINSNLGLKLKTSEIIACLRKTRLEAKEDKKRHVLEVAVPAYRGDFIHEIDIVEETAIGYGYKDFPTHFTEGGVGSYHPAEVWAQRSRIVMVGAGCLEMVNISLTAKRDLELFNLHFIESEEIIIANPVSREYDTLRKMLLLSLFKNLQFNRSMEKPFRLFEVGDTFFLDSTHLTRTRRELHLACVVHSDRSDFTEIRSLFDYYITTMGLAHSISITTSQHPSFIPGRTGTIVYNKKEIGIIGEIHPQILQNFGLDYPTSAFEINLMPFFEDHEE